MRKFTPCSYGWSSAETVSIKEINWFLPKSQLITVCEDTIHGYGSELNWQAPVNEGVLKIFIYRWEDGRAVLDDIVSICPKSESQFVQFELGLQYYTKFRWHLKDRATEEFKWTTHNQGLLEGVGATIKRESIQDDDWETEPRLQEERRKAAKAAKAKKVRRKRKQVARGF